MTTVTISLRYGRTAAGVKVPAPQDTVELERLSPRARALALAVAASLGGKAGPIWLEADRPYGESWEHRPPEERDAYADPARDARRALQEWNDWDRWYADDTADAYWYLERQAAKLPEGWHVLGPDPHTRVADPEQPADDWYSEDAAAHMGIAVSGVRTTLKRLGVRPYRHEPLPGGGVRAVYSAAAVRAAHAARPGRGARTDLQEQP